MSLLLCLLLYREPAGYLVPRSYTDGQIALEEAVYLESADDADWSGYRILNYKDAETPMQIISGKAIQLETARYYLGSVLIGGAVGAFAAIWWNMRKYSRYHIERKIGRTV